MSKAAAGAPAKAQLFTGGAATAFATERLQLLLAEDAQFIAAKPLQSVIEAKTQPGLRLAEVVQTVMEGYTDRPALGQRARELVRDPVSGRTSLRLLPRFDTCSYGELWSRAGALAAAWRDDVASPVKPGDFVAILGFASPDYAALALASIRIGAVIVPLQTTAPAHQHADIIAETKPRLLATGIAYLDAAVEAALKCGVPARVVVFDYESRDDAQREAFEAACKRVSDSPLEIETIDAAVARGKTLPAPLLHAPPGNDDPLAWLFYTSGTTGVPKGAMLTEQIIKNTWLYSAEKPSITLSYMPMSHLVGYGYMFLALANGGTSYCAPKSDLSTLFEDLALVRPTMASLVPRVCEMFYQHFLGEVDRRIAAGADEAIAAEEVKFEMREKLLGGRLLSVGCGSAVLSPEVNAFMQSMLGVHMAIGYSSTEMATATVMVDGKIQRPPVIAYKLADVPELGYFRSDKPYPRGEFCVKIAKFMGGYYKRPDLTADKFDEDGFYRSGDVMAEIAPDQLVYLDRTNNVLKLSQGEFVAVARLEALYTQSAAIRQIYIYGSSDRAFLLAVVVPADELAAQLTGDSEQVKRTIRRALQHVAEEHQLNSYEIPREFLIETEPFSQENGLLTGIGKFSRPNFKARYGERLEQTYAQLAQDQVAELRTLRLGGADRPVPETVMRALQATLGVAAADVEVTSNFADLGGDSLSALSFSLLLEEIFGVDVPVGVIVNPAGDIGLIASYVEAQRDVGRRGASFSSVHAADSAIVRASDLKLEKFIDADTLAKAHALPAPDEAIRTVLLTGATGFLGRFQAIAWLERLSKTGGRLILVSRGADAASARQRVEAALDTDPVLLQHFRAFAADHLEVLPGDLGLPNLGLDDATWRRLAETVDVIAHTGAHVNHVLPYTQLFAANVVGTAELIRLALSTRLKRFHYVSTLGVIALTDALVEEDGDIRTLVPACAINDSYANGYGLSKWASEVLLREAHDLCGLPVSVFRPGMILAHSEYAGQLNVPDMFTRLLFSLAVTGVAPATFYAETLADGRPRARYEGVSVDFLANAITAIGARDERGFQSYNLASPHKDGVSLDDFVDWLIESGCAIERVGSYSAWLAHFETALHALPEAQRHQSVLAILGPYHRVQHAQADSFLPVNRFRDACAAAGLEVPRLSPAMIRKYVADLRGLGLL